MKPSYQTLLKIDCGTLGSARIHRGHNGQGYFLSGIDNTLGIECGNFPLTQEEVAEEFKKQNKEWRFE